MNRKELVRRIAAVMRDNGIRKPISSQKQVFHISDDEGNTKDFVVKKTGKDVLFTIDDVESIMDACIYVIEDALKHGDSVSIRGFGTLGLHYRKARTTKHPATGNTVEVDARYVPKFIFGDNLRLCAKIFELSLDEKGDCQPQPDIEDTEGIEDAGGDF